MNGMGTIRLEAHNHDQWRVTDHSQARATIALLRPWIGPVKRGQAARALAAVDTQYALGRVRGRPGRRRSPIIIPPVRRGILGSVARRRLDRAWAAGFLDAEGCFGLARARPRVGGLPWYRIRAPAAQHGEVGTPALVLRRLHRIIAVGRIERHGEPDDYKWVSEGIPAVQRVLEVVGPWLGSAKREQARYAIAASLQRVQATVGPAQASRPGDRPATVQGSGASVH